MPPAVAYIERSAVHSDAKCYLQARADARAAIALLLAEQRVAAAAGQQGGVCSKEQPACSGTSSGGSSAAERRSQLALAYERLGHACMAEPDHPDRDCRGAAKAYLRSMETLADRGSGPSAFSSGMSSSSSDSELEEAVRQGLEEASKDLTVRQLDEVGAGAGLPLCLLLQMSGWLAGLLATVGMLNRGSYVCAQRHACLEMLLS